MKAKILFLGSKSFGYSTVEKIIESRKFEVCGIITCEDRSDVRSAYDRFDRLARAEGVSFVVLGKGGNLKEHLDRLEPDLCLVVGWYWILPDHLLTQIKFGFVGIHNSILPRFRGGSPLVWSIIDGGETVGYSIFQLSGGVDEGGIFYQEQVNFDENDSIGEALFRIERSVVQNISTVIEKICMGTIKPKQQGVESLSYCMPRRESDGEINWHQRSDKVHDFIRAQAEPYPGAFTWLKGKKVRVLKTRKIDVKYYGAVGQVSYNNQGLPVVICADGTALLLEKYRSSSCVTFGVIFGDEEL